MKKIWTTIDGKKLKIYEMETSHINNCIRMLEKQVEELIDMGEDFIDASGDTDGTCNLGCWDVSADIDRKNDYIIAFKEELRRRNL